MTLKMTRWCVAVVAMNAFVTGCVVPQKKYDQALETMQAEQAAHQQAASQLEAERAAALDELARARSEVSKRQQALAVTENAAAQSGLEVQQIVTERDEYARRVEQLRSELARVGDHLRAYSEQREQLQSALDAAEKQAERAASLEADHASRMLIMRDVSHSLHDVVESRHALISMSGTRSLIRLPESRLFSKNALALTLEGSQILRRLGQVIAPYRDARLELVGQPKSASYRPEDWATRLQKVASALRQSGVPNARITVTSPEPQDAAPAGSTGAEHGDGSRPGSAVSQPRSARARRDTLGSVDILVDIASKPAPQEKTPESRIEPEPVAIEVGRDESEETFSVEAMD